jgi:hypothetical protein
MARELEQTSEALVAGLDLALQVRLGKSEYSVRTIL